MGDFISSILGSGVTGITIAVVGLLAVFIIAERWMFYTRSIGKSFSFFKIINEYVSKNEVSKALAACDANPKLPSAIVIKEILMRADRDDASMDAGFDIGMSKLEPLVNKRVDFITTLANVATLLGLFGTIIGLIITFGSFTNGTAEKSALTEGISLAMSTTAMGLVVAIPVTFIGSMIESKRDRAMSLFRENLEEILDQLKNRYTK